MKIHGATVAVIRAVAKVSGAAGGTMGSRDAGEVKLITSKGSFLIQDSSKQIVDDKARMHHLLNVGMSVAAQFNYDTELVMNYESIVKAIVDAAYQNNINLQHRVLMPLALELAREPDKLTDFSISKI